jgi:hypothetical protein
MGDGPYPRQIRVFLSSPGDVADERALARRLLKDELPYDPLLRGRVIFEVVSWDDPAVETPMPATITPQAAVNRFGPKPSQCDVVVVVLWSRLGTHLDVGAFRKPDGKPYLSGTEWEFEDAIKSQPQPEVFVYRRTEVPQIALDDPDWAEKRRQYKLVKQFFKRFKNSDKSFRGSWKSYDTATSFQRSLGSDLRHILREYFDRSKTGSVVMPTPGWLGAPYPGLRSFSFGEATIFFGRGRQVDALIARLRDPGQRFLGLVGASGSGKSSLVHAGLLPRLKDGAIEGSQYWPVLAFTPGAYGGDPLLALASKLAPMLPDREANSPLEIATALVAAPSRLSSYIDRLVANQLVRTTLVLFVDQFEELFTLSADDHRRNFIELLAQAASDTRVHVLASLRSDFLSQCVAEPILAALLQSGTFVLGSPEPAALLDMIRKPAEQAGFDIDEGLVDEILKDAGPNPGEALPLVAFCLEELYRRTLSPERHLTLDAYHALGGLHGAVGRRAGDLLEGFRKAKEVDLDVVLTQVFRALVHVDAAGKPTRRRASRDGLMRMPSPIPQLIKTLIDPGRLLLAGDADTGATITLTHEALLEGWPILRDWVEHNRAQMQRVQRLLLLLRANEPRDRRHAVKALGEMGPAATEATHMLIITSHEDPSGDIRHAAVEALAEIGPEAEVLPALIAALRNDPYDEVRRAAVKALVQTGQVAKAVPALIEAFRDDRDTLCIKLAGGALSRIGPADVDVVPTLIAAMHDEREEVQWVASETLGRVGPAAAQAVPELIAIVRNVAVAEVVRRAAIEALGSIGPQASEAIPALIDVLGNTGGLRQTATWAIKSILPDAKIQGGQ